MKKLSPNALRLANTINSDTAWIFLLEIILPDPEAEHLCIARNNEDVYWNNTLFQAFPFEISEAKQDNKGTLSSLDIDVDNTTRDLEFYLQQGGGGADSRVILRCIAYTEDSKNKTDAEFEEYYLVKSTTVTEKTIRFSLGNAYPSKARRPWGRYMKNNCRFKYKGIECGCTSSLKTCNHTLKDCRERKNSQRFGGFPGIPQGGLYV